MATRGIIGFINNGKVYGKYNHSDSYPENLGKFFVQFCDSIPDWEILKNNFSRIEWVNGDSDDFTDVEVVFNCISLAQKVIFTNDIDFAKDSLFCEYGYFINIDTEELEFYLGFCKEQQEGNRFGIIPNEGGYFPIKLVGKCNVNEIPVDWIDKYYPKELENDKTTEAQN